MDMSHLKNGSDVLRPFLQAQMHWMSLWLCLQFIGGFEQVELPRAITLLS